MVQWEPWSGPPSHEIGGQLGGHTLTGCARKTAGQVRARSSFTCVYEEQPSETGLTAPSYAASHTVVSGRRRSGLGADGPVWAQTVLSGRRRSCLGADGPIWAQTVVFGRRQSCLGADGPVWAQTVLSGRRQSGLGADGPVWAHTGREWETPRTRW